MVKGMLQLLSNCPSETAHLRKELLIAAKHILTTDLRSRTYTHAHTPTQASATQDNEKRNFFSLLSESWRLFEAHFNTFSL